METAKKLYATTNFKTILTSKFDTAFAADSSDILEIIPGKRRPSIVEQIFSLWYAAASVGGSYELCCPTIFVNK